MTQPKKARAHAPAPQELDAEERMSRDEIEALQLARLQDTVRHAYRNVPFYTQKFDGVGVHPDDIRELSDLERLPFTANEDLRRLHDPRDSSLAVAVLGAEPWTNEMRSVIEEGLGIDDPAFRERFVKEARAGLTALDIYGLSEVMDPGVGSKYIESKDGPHIWEDQFRPEVIDSDTGQSLPGTARPSTRRIERITGRNDDMIVHVEPVCELSAADGARVIAALEREVKARVGTTVEVDLANPGSLERSSGKMKRVYDRWG